MKNGNNFEEDIIKRLKNIKEVANLNSEDIELLSKPKSVKSAEIKLNGKKYPAWRIVHNDSLGPAKGGIRFHKEVSEEETKALSFWMSLKNSLAGLPYGGGKGGINIDASKLSSKELEKISRSYIDNFYQYLGEDIDIPAPDLCTGPQTISWMLDEYEKITGKHEPAMITGKPPELGGIEFRATATAKGGVTILEHFIKSLFREKNSTRNKPEENSFNKPRKELSVAIQGFGEVGEPILKMLNKKGYRIVATTDSKGGIYNEEGLNPQKLTQEKRTAPLSKSEQGETISNKQLLEMNVDILILSATANQITEDNADRIKANYILEMANGPVSSEGEKKLFNNNIIVIPDILANSGGVVASYFEWVQNKSGLFLSSRELEKEFESIIGEAWNRVYQLFSKHSKSYDKNIRTRLSQNLGLFNFVKNIDLRTAAYIISIRRILKAERWRGNLSNSCD